MTVSKRKVARDIAELALLTGEDETIDLLSSSIIGLAVRKGGESMSYTDQLGCVNVDIHRAPDGTPPKLELKESKLRSWLTTRKKDPEEAEEA